MRGVGGVKFGGCFVGFFGYIFCLVVRCRLEGVLLSGVRLSVFSRGRNFLYFRFFRNWGFVL